jgi:hypothetical protein
MRSLFALLLFAVSSLAAAQSVDIGMALNSPSEDRIYSFHDHETRPAYRIASFDRSNKRLAAAVPLSTLAERQTLAMSYPEAFYGCEGDPHRQARIQRLTAELDSSPEAFRERFLNLVALPLQGDFVVLADTLSAVVMDRRTGARLPGSPCGDVTDAVRVSMNRQRVALVSHTFEYGKYTAGPYMVRVYSYDAGQYRLTASLSTERRPLDLHLADDGAWAILDADGRPSLNPVQWVFALAGHLVSVSTISLVSYSAEGTMIGRSEMARGVELGAARFLPANEQAP